MLAALYPAMFPCKDACLLWLVEQNQSVKNENAAVQASGGRTADCGVFFRGLV
jgi:hypothetical protein